jgi:hypothetical protein
LLRNSQEPGTACSISAAPQRSAGRVGDHCRAAHTTEVAKNTVPDSRRAECQLLGPQTQRLDAAGRIYRACRTAVDMYTNLEKLAALRYCYDLGGCVTVRIASIQGSKRLTFCSATDRVKNGLIGETPYSHYWCETDRRRVPAPNNLLQKTDLHATSSLSLLYEKVPHPIRRSRKRHEETISTS